VFDMYRRRAPDVASRILVVDGTGRASELGRYEAFLCEPARLELGRAERCPLAQKGRIDYVVRDMQIYFDAHLSNEKGPEEATIVWRTFTLEDRPGPPAFEDCVLARCSARRKGDAR
jgi:hypothetical protein